MNTALSISLHWRGAFTPSGHSRPNDSIAPGKAAAMGLKLNSIAFAILGALFFAGVANADSITYQVTGTMTFARGERVSFSFESTYSVVTGPDEKLTLSPRANVIVPVTW